MSGVKYLVGSPDIYSRPMPVYCDTVIDFLSDLSRDLMRDPRSRKYSDVMSVAFWCRKSNVMKLKQEYQGGQYRLGRGLAFHIAPSNIPVNFAFSYFFGLLAGNANVVRVSSKQFPQVDIICETMEATLECHPEIRKRTAIVSYPAESEHTQEFCAMADLRIIWGGDKTISKIRQYPSKPKCIDLVFADRYSVCAIDGEAVLRCSEQELERLAEGFYNDTYLIDQNACSSPRIVFWVNGSEAARERFWSGVMKYTEKKYALQNMIAMDKYVQACTDAVRYEEISQITRQNGNLLYRAELTKLDKEHDLRGKAGYFYEYDLHSYDELFNLVNEKYQTLTYFGLNAQELRDMVISRELNGIDRVVPIGSAIDVGVIWDGYDIITMLSRVVTAV